MTENVSRFVSFLKDARGEVSKITWPERKVTTITTYAVIISVFLMGVYLGSVDAGLGKVIEWILR